VSTDEADNTLRFTPTDYGAKTVTVTSADNGSFDASPLVAMIEHTVSGAGSGYERTNADSAPRVQIPDVRVTVNQPGLFISRTGTPNVLLAEAGSVSEGDEVGYSIRLMAKPSANVTVTRRLNGQIESVDAAQRSVTFTPTDWSTPKPLTLTVKDDDRVDEYRTATVVHILTSDDPIYNTDDGISDAQVSDRNKFSMRISDNDLPGFIVWTSRSGLANNTWPLPPVPETGSQAYTIRLAKQPRSYSNPPVSDVTNKANPGISAFSLRSRAPGIGIPSFNESGNRSSVSYAIVLTAPPTHDVTVTPTMDTPGVLTASPITFTPTGPKIWNIEQTMTITAVNNDIQDPRGVRFTNLTFSVTSQDSRYNNLRLPASRGGMFTSGRMVVRDDDIRVTVSETDLTILENRGMDTYTIVLGRRPDLDKLTGRSRAVTVRPMGSDDIEISLPGDAEELTFDRSNWNTPQTVQVTGVNDDDINNPDRSVTISHVVTGSGGERPADVIVTLADDDDLPGINLSTTALEVSEDSGSDTYTVVLNSPPTHEVRVTPESTDTTVATVMVPPTLTFTTENWYIHGLTPSGLLRDREVGPTRSDSPARPSAP